MFKTTIAAMAGAAALVSAGAASAATLYNLNVYDSGAGFTGSLGTVSVSGQGTSTLSFDVLLNSNVFYQMSGNGGAHDAVWFDLDKAVGGGTTSFTNNVTFAITSPNAPGGSAGGDYPTGGQFTGSRDLNDFGQGWSSGHDYGVRVSDGSAGSNLNYYGGELTFTVHANDGSLLSLDSDTYNGKTVFGGADLRQCPGSDPKSSSCKTGPVGFSLAQQTSAVPEPASWAIMLMGFGGLGAMLRQRRQSGLAFVRA
jgi:hypothetical protein